MCPIKIGSIELIRAGWGGVLLAAPAGVWVDAVVAASWAALGWRHLRKGQARTDDVRRRDRLARSVVGALPGGGRLMAQAERIR